MSTPKMVETDLIIIGAGPAGLSAGIYAARSNVKTIILKGKRPSALSLTKEITNYPGFPTVSGSELLERFVKHAIDAGAEIIEGDVFSLALDFDPKMVTTRDNTIYMAKAVIIATGKDLGKESIKNEKELIGRGISYCAVCDGPLYKGRPVILYGKDEEAVDDTLALVQMNNIVTFITPISLEELKKKVKNPALVDELAEKVEKVYEKTLIIEAIGKEGGGLKEVVIAPADDKRNKEKWDKVSGDILFVISHISSTGLYEKAGLELDKKGNIIVDDLLRTNHEGVFAAGDITGHWPQVVQAVAEGGRAAIEAARYIRHHKK